MLRLTFTVKNVQYAEMMRKNKPVSDGSLAILMSCWKRSGLKSGMNIFNCLIITAGKRLKVLNYQVSVWIIQNVIKSFVD